ncbi:Ca2+-transporting ATPase [Dyadobacter sp. BE34]|uniref:Ca2+-transporting ATPase n=1 Tax=Dyadobacter fermentans TaxID=94254 RepID=A0ABU1QUH5_9BACT|nr:MULTISPECIES: cation-translocating P-type ATPase [Dyadobacter]MDR6804814.1 Ca2+-transporting ATPase [Dyadobacter fermentans]MDR7043427.1 Ca2+-transporting ATPase [Dyadobacter sp. BE242]MDR7197739.1 Ca2+-transporting ATPase [Dyadobacter sp. BE34]MDR7214828.1 Ca2+-transporting ATPase [Dyadobacter sp. BE31]MDR7262363.1 Ca2+-transporting ATPase [Dyadobacter sp. BE32]
MSSSTINTPRGLSTSQVLESRSRYGENKVEDRSESGFWAAVSGLVKEPMLILLIAASAIYFVTGSRGEGFFMLGAILVISIISIYQDGKSRNALRELKSLTEPKCKVIRDGLEIEILREDIVVGDWLIMEEGNKIPADGAVLEAHDFSVNESILTGESLAVAKNEPGSEVFQGTLVASGRAVARVGAVGAQTKLAAIGASLQSIEEEPTPLQVQITNFVKKMAIAGGAVFLLVWVINYIRTQVLLDSLLKALTLAMSILPEEIPVAFTTFMALGAWRLMKMGIIVKRTQTIETLGSATVICTDKTGTITENKMQLASLYIHAQNLIQAPDAPLSDQAKDLLTMAMWASEPVPFDPMEIALHEAYVNCAAADMRSGFKLVHEYPLEGKPPMMTHVFENRDSERIVAAKGAPEALMAVSGLPEDEKRTIWEVVNVLAAKGYRVLGVGQSSYAEDVFPEKQQQLPFHFLGLVAFYDPPKNNIKAVFQAFSRAGIQVKIITGDNAATTQNIARQIGFEGAERVLLGEELVGMDEKALQDKVMQTGIFARMFPEAKLRVVNALKAQGQIVAMTGDGVNDGPALKAAHIGIAMGKKGTEIAKQASSLILVDDDFARMVDAVAMGRKIYVSLKNAIRYIISIHIPIILTVFIPLALSWTYPNIFTPVHIIFFEMIMGPTCSIIYENEPLEKDLLLQKPRPFTSTFFSLKELSVSILQGLVITAGMLLLYQYALAQSYDERLTRSMVFIALLAANVCLTLVNRSFRHSIWTTIRYKNNLVPMIIGITVVLSVLIFLIPDVTRFFSLAQVSVNQLLVSIGTGFLFTIWYELVKIWRAVPADNQ